MTNIIKNSFAQALREEGFKKKANTFYLDCPESILVANLQKSQHGPSYYINLAVWLKVLGDSNAPKEHHCHVRLRIGVLLGDKFEKILNLENDAVTDEKRESTITAALKQTAAPFLKSCSTLTGLKQQILEGGLPSYLVQKRVAELIGATD